MLFVCPKCSSRFVRVEGNSAVCEKGHCYDKSRDGYYNFLLDAPRGVHGDNREMLLARRAFLESGAYLPLAMTVSRLALEHCTKKEPSLIDLGCGEGYYTEYVRDSLLESGTSPRIAAFDISKDAVRLTAKRLKTGDFCVASAYHVPAPDKGFDIALNMFSPLALSQTVRILNDGGIFIMAIPAEEHLFELKEVLYDTPYKNELAPFELEGLTFIKSERVNYKMHLDSKEKILSLFNMTPYAHRTKPEGKERLLNLETLDITSSFVVIVYKKPC